MDPEKQRKTLNFLRKLVKEQKALEEEEKSTQEAAKFVLLLDTLDSINTELKSSNENTSRFTDALSQLKIEAPVVNVPEIKAPEVKIPEIKVPKPEVTVNIPEIKVPKAEVKIPEIKVPQPKVTVNVPDVIVPPITLPDEMTVEGSVSVQNSPDNAVPVRLVDTKGNPVNVGGGASVVSGGGGSKELKRTYTVITHGSKTLIGSTAVQLTSVSDTAQIGVLIKASNNNSGTLYVGSSHVTTLGTSDTTDGFELGPGESTTLPADRADKIYVVSDTEEQRLTWSLV